MSDFSSRSNDPPRRRHRRRREWLFVGGVLIVIAVVWLVAARDMFRPLADATATKERPSTQPAAIHSTSPAEAPSAEAALIDDDGRTLWHSPTDGPPLKLAYLPPGIEVFLAVRPAALMEHPEGEKVVAALGPFAADAIQQVEQAAGLPWRDVDQLLVGWSASGDRGWNATFVVTTLQPAKADALRTRLANGVQHEHAGATYFIADELAYYQPEREERRTLVITSPAVMNEILELADRAPPLRRDVERLVAHTDRARHVTLIVAPHLLLSDGRGLLAGSMAGLRRPVVWFFGDGLAAIALSLHWDANFFVELLAMPTLDVPADRAADKLVQHVAELPDRVEDYVLTLSPDPYGRRIVARFPGMVRKLSAYTRHEFGKEYAVLRCYLPVIAGHNLLMGAEFTLAEAQRGTASAGDATAETVSTDPGSVRERLQMRTSLRFERESLESALDMLSKDVGVEIVIRGPDLQSEGITRNQSLGIDLADIPAEAILVEILRLANPDKMAAGPADERQKLVYVFARRTPHGPEVVFVTTRAQARERGETLPQVFASDWP